MSFNFKYQLYCERVLIATVTMEDAPRIGDVLCVIVSTEHAIEQGIEIISGDYEVISGITRMIAINYHESGMRKIEVRKVRDQPALADHRRVVDHMIRWERGGLDV